MPRRLPTWEECAKRAVEREARHAALRWQGDAVRRELAQRCAAVAGEPQDTADERLVAQLSRLEAALQALEPAAQLLQVDRPDEVLSAEGPTAVERQAQLVAVLGCKEGAQQAPGSIDLRINRAWCLCLLCYEFEHHQEAEPEITFPCSIQTLSMY